jgi:hypothetical protein
MQGFDDQAIVKFYIYQLLQLFFHLKASKLQEKPSAFKREHRELKQEFLICISIEKLKNKYICGVA